MLPLSLGKIFFAHNIYGGVEHPSLPKGGERGDIPAWLRHSPSLRRGNDRSSWVGGGAGEGCGEPAEPSVWITAPFLGKGHIHKSITAAVVSHVPWQGRDALPPAREGLRGDNILSKTLFLILPLALAQIRLRAAQISSEKPLKRFKMSFSQFEGFCLANPVQGRLQASRPLLCC